MNISNCSVVIWRHILSDIILYPTTSNPASSRRKDNVDFSYLAMVARRKCTYVRFKDIRNLLIDMSR